MFGSIRNVLISIGRSKFLLFSAITEYEDISLDRKVQQAFEESKSHLGKLPNLALLKPR